VKCFSLCWFRRVCFSGSRLTPCVEVAIRWFLAFVMLSISMYVYTNINCGREREGGSPKRTLKGVPCLGAFWWLKLGLWWYIARWVCCFQLMLAQISYKVILFFS
jgi:hypothetical protein